MGAGVCAAGKMIDFWQRRGRWNAPTDGPDKPATAPRTEGTVRRVSACLPFWEGVSSLAGYIPGRNNQRAMREDTTTEIRCGQCHKLLARGWARDAHIVHKCPRCGAYNTLRATRPHSEPHDEPPGSKHC